VQPLLGRAEAGKLIVMAVSANARVNVILLNMSFSSVEAEMASAQIDGELQILFPPVLAGPRNFDACEAE
jgi:hypothetical protein